MSAHAREMLAWSMVLRTNASRNAEALRVAVHNARELAILIISGQYETFYKG